MTTSATGGYLSPELPLDSDLTLDIIWQSFVAGVSGLAGEMVRPRWQPVVPKMPEIGENWAAVGVTEEVPDASPALLHRDAQDRMGETYSVRHTDLKVLVSFYGDNSAAYAARLRDGIGIPQNHDGLKRHAMGLVGCSGIITVPELWQNQWQRRCDVHIYARRMVTQRYAIKHVSAANTNPTRG